MKTAIVDGRKCIYHFDLIRINTKNKTRTLKKILPLNELRKECHKIWVEPAYPIAREYGYNTRIEFVAPTQRFFEILQNYEQFFWSYKISRVELARDKFGKGTNENNEKVHDQLKYKNKKYTTDHHVKIQTVEEAIENDDESLTGNKTGYFGSKHFKNVIYPRKSKINNEPCVHEEWRITSATVIKRKTGIKTIDDLMNFDIQEFLETQDERQINYGTINTMALGKWLLGTKKRKFTYREMLKVGLRARHFLIKHKLRTFADLRHFLKEEKKTAKTKTGRKNAWEHKVLSLRSYNRFFSKAEI
jgi:hypothetical protein